MDRFRPFIPAHLRDINPRSQIDPPSWRVGLGVSVGFLAYYILRTAKSGAFTPVWRKLLCLDTPFTVTGYVAPGYEAVRAAFEQNFREGHELGAQLCIYVKGRVVVDLAGKNHSYPHQYDETTLQTSFSSSKAVTSLVVAMLVDQGLLDYNAPIAMYWPEFAQNGKENITVAELMRHEAGLDIFATPISKELFFESGDNENTNMAKLIEATVPEWDAESKRCYHAMTRGLVVNELVKKVTKQNVGQLLERWIAQPLQAEVYCGFPENLEFRVAPVQMWSILKILCKFVPVLAGFGDKKIAAMLKYARKGSFAHRRWNSKGMSWKPTSADGPAGANCRGYHATVSPSTNCIMNARAAARVFGCVANNGIDHITLLKPSTLQAALRSPPVIRDVGIGIETEFTDGGWCRNLMGMWNGPCVNEWYGWAGFGGSCLQFNPALNASFAYVMTGMCMEMSDLRTNRLRSAFESCLLHAPHDDVK